jgi:hypothetical protein
MPTISCFMVVRDAIRQGYPFAEAIASAAKRSSSSKLPRRFGNHSDRGPSKNNAGINQEKDNNKTLLRKRHGSRYDSKSLTPKS